MFQKPCSQRIVIFHFTRVVSHAAAIYIKKRILIFLLFGIDGYPVRIYYDTFNLLLFDHLNKFVITDLFIARTGHKFHKDTDTEQSNERCNNQNDEALLLGISAASRSSGAALIILSSVRIAAVIIITVILVKVIIHL